MDPNNRRKIDDIHKIVEETVDHSSNKHLNEFRDENRGEPIGIHTREDFVKHIEETLTSETTRCFRTSEHRNDDDKGTSYFYNDKSNTFIVIPGKENEPPTCYRPEKFEVKFDYKLLKEHRDTGNVPALYKHGIYELMPELRASEQIHQPEAAAVASMVTLDPQKQPDKTNKPLAQTLKPESTQEQKPTIVALAEQVKGNIANREDSQTVENPKPEIITKPEVIAQQDKAIHEQPVAQRVVTLPQQKQPELAAITEQVRGSRTVEIPKLNPAKAQEAPQLQNETPAAKTTAQRALEPLAAVARPVAKGAGIMVRGAGGVLRSLLSVVDEVLDIFCGTPQPKFTMREFATNPQLRANEMAAVERRDGALGRMGKDIKAERNISEDDLRMLNVNDLENIKAKGDAHLNQLINEREGAERRRSEDRGRGR